MSQIEILILTDLLWVRHYLRVILVKFDLEIYYGLAIGG
jgi:hypothetical protein